MENLVTSSHLPGQLPGETTTKLLQRTRQGVGIAIKTACQVMYYAIFWYINRNKRYFSYIPDSQRTKKVLVFQCETRQTAALQKKEANRLGTEGYMHEKPPPRDAISLQLEIYLYIYINVPI